jgi:hypothetical protein
VAAGPGVATAAEGAGQAGAGAATAMAAAGPAVAGLAEAGGATAAAGPAEAGGATAAAETNPNFPWITLEQDVVEKGDGDRVKKNYLNRWNAPGPHHSVTTST